MADLKSYIDSLPVDKDTKAQTWDSFYSSKDPSTFTSSFGKLSIPKDAKADLYDAAFNQKNLGTYSAPVDNHPDATLSGAVGDLWHNRDKVLDWLAPDLSGNHPIKNTALGVAQGLAGMVLHPIDAQVNSGATPGMYPGIAPTLNKQIDETNQKELLGTNTPTTRRAQEQIEQAKQSPAHFVGSSIIAPALLGMLSHGKGGEEAPAETPKLMTETPTPEEVKAGVSPIKRVVEAPTTPEPSTIPAVKNAQISVDQLRERAKARYEARMASKPHEGLKPGEILRTPEGNMVTPADTGGFHEHLDDGSLKLHPNAPPEGTTVAGLSEPAQPSVPKLINDSKPRYGYQSRNFKLDFEDPIDKAAYTTVQGTKNKMHDQIVDYLQDKFPDEQSIQDHGNRVKSTIKDLAKNAEPDQDTLTIPAHDRPTPGQNPSVVPTAVEGRSPEVQQSEAAVYPAIGKVMRLQQLQTGHQINTDLATVRQSLKDQEPLPADVQGRLSKLAGQPITQATPELVSQLEDLQGRVQGAAPRIQYLKAGAKTINDPAMQERLAASRQRMVDAFNDPNTDADTKAKLDKALSLDENGNRKNVLYQPVKTAAPPVDLPPGHPEAPFTAQAFGSQAPELSLENLRAATGENTRTLMENISPQQRKELANVSSVVSSYKPPSPEELADARQQGLSITSGGPEFQAASGELQKLKQEIYTGSLKKDVQTARLQLQAAVADWQRAGGHLTDSPLIDAVSKLPDSVKKGLPDVLLGKKTIAAETPSANPEVGAPQPNPETGRSSATSASQTPATQLGPGGKALMGKTNVIVRKIADEFPNHVEHAESVVAAAERFADAPNKQAGALYRGMRVLYQGLKINAPDALQKAIDVVKTDPERGSIGQNISPYSPSEIEAISGANADHFLTRYEAMSPMERATYKENIWAEELQRSVDESNDPALRARYEALKKGLPQSASFTISLTNKFREYAIAREQALAAKSVIRQASGTRYVTDLRIRNTMEQFDQLMDELPEAERYRFLDNMETGSGQAPNVIESLPQKFLDKWQKKYDFPLPDLNDIATLLRGNLDRARNDVISETGRLQNYIEDYLPHIFVNVGKAKDFARDWLSHRPLEGDKGFLREREHVFIQDAVAHGLQLATTNPVRLSMMRIEQLDRFTMAHKIKNEFVASQMATKFPSGAQPQDWVPLNDNLFEPKAFSPTSGGMTSYGKYYAPSSIAKVFNNFVSTGLSGKWKVPYTDLSLYDAMRGGSNLANQFQLSLSLFHASESMFNSAISEASLGLQDLVNGRPLRGAARLANTATIVGPGLRDIYYGSHLMAHVNDSSKFLNMSMAGRDFELANGRMSIDPFFRTHFQESIPQTWKILSDDLRPKGDRARAALKLPFQIAGRAVEATAWPIMDQLVPRIKMGAFYQMANSIREDMVGRPAEEQTLALQKAWDSVDNRFGQVVYENLFMQRSIKDGLALAMRSPGWNIGTIREVGLGTADLVKAIGNSVTKGQRLKLSQRAGYTLALAGFTAYLNAIYQVTHPSAPKVEGLDYLYPRNGTKDDKGNWNRVYPKLYTYDFVNLFHDPEATVLHKESPLLATMGELLQNKNYFGREIYDPSDSGAMKLANMAKFAMLEQYKPFSVENAQERGLRGDQGIRSFIEGSAAILPAPRWASRTKAENLAFDYFQRQQSQGPEDDIEFEKKASFLKLRQSVRDGKFDPDKLQEAMDKNQISPKQIGYLFQTYRQPDLEIWAKRLPFNQVEKVWDAGNTEEKQKMLPILYQKLASVSGSEQQRVIEKLDKFNQANQ